LATWRSERTETVCVVDGRPASRRLRSKSRSARRGRSHPIGTCASAEQHRATLGDRTGDSDMGLPPFADWRDHSVSRTCATLIVRVDLKSREDSV
jgi:hypothetical protein